jgi:hypothetical protein
VTRQPSLDRTGGKIKRGFRDRASRLGRDRGMDWRNPPLRRESSGPNRASVKRTAETQTRWRREWDSNPRYLSVHTLSKRARLSARPYLRRHCLDDSLFAGRHPHLTHCRSAPVRIPGALDRLARLDGRSRVRHGGEGGIRTLEGRESLPVFKTGAFNRSATSPGKAAGVRLGLPAL